MKLAIPAREIPSPYARVEAAEIGDTVPVEELPHLPLETAMAIIRQMGIGGWNYVRTGYVNRFYYAAEKVGATVTFKQTYRNGRWMHRMTRTK